MPVGASTLSSSAGSMATLVAAILAEAQVLEARHLELTFGVWGFRFGGLGLRA